MEDTAAVLSALEAIPLPSDGDVLLVMHVALLGLLLFAIVRELYARVKAGRGATTFTVTRGERSMAILTGIFATSVGLYALAIQVADDVLVGRKSFLIAFDFVALTYLFFFNDWFRNDVIGTAIDRYQEKR
jgi:hypothetical protein